MSNPERVALYARYSSDLSRDASIEDQLRRCRDRAEMEGWNVVASFEDRAVSGASLLRPGYQSLMQAVQAGDVDIVLAEALDRLSRDQEDIAALYKRLGFLGIRLVTVAEGEIGALHIGLKGTMNALYLKDLADKTRRGLEGRARAGRSAGGICYGYAVIPGEERGGREIVPAEAAVIRRIFESFAAGRSPKAIARMLNADGIPGPRGALWRDTAIRGHRQRGTGILNNELYIGRLVWNRLRYVKDPQTGKRVSRSNPPEAWVIESVPELRVIDDALWDAVKARQSEIDATPAVQGMKQSRFWQHRRKNHLLTGLLKCGACGGGYVSAGRDYLACSNARKLETCHQRRGIRRRGIEAFVLDLLRERLMQPAAVEAFVSAFHREINQERAASEALRSNIATRHAAISKKLDGLYEAIADGLRSPGLLAKLESLEAEKAELERDLAEPAPSPVRLHPDLAGVYRRKVEDLGAALNDPAIRDEALPLLRGLIEAVRLTEDSDGWKVSLEGDICAMIDLGTTSDRSTKTEDIASPGSIKRSTKVVAGAGYQRYLLDLTQAAA